MKERGSKERRTSRGDPPQKTVSDPPHRGTLPPPPSPRPFLPSGFPRNSFRRPQMVSKGPSWRGCALGYVFSTPPPPPWLCQALVMRRGPGNTSWQAHQYHEHARLQVSSMLLFYVSSRSSLRIVSFENHCGKLTWLLLGGRQSINVLGHSGLTCSSETPTLAVPSGRWFCSVLNEVLATYLQLWLGIWIWDQNSSTTLGLWSQIADMGTMVDLSSLSGTLYQSTSAHIVASNHCLRALRLPTWQGIPEKEGKSPPVTSFMLKKLQGALVRFGYSWAWNSASGSGFRFRLFLQRYCFSVFEDSFDENAQFQFQKHSGSSCSARSQKSSSSLSSSSSGSAPALSWKSKVNNTGAQCKLFQNLSERQEALSGLLRQVFPLMKMS